MFDSDCSHTDHVKETSSLGAEGSEFDRCAPRMDKIRTNIKICWAVFCVVCLLFNLEESKPQILVDSFKESILPRVSSKTKKRSSGFT